MPHPPFHSLESALRISVEGEVRFDSAARAIYSTDASNYRQVPVGVVVPRTLGDVREAMRIAREHDVPLLGRGGGTSLAGQCCNAALVLDFSQHLNRVHVIDPEARLARVDPGIVLDRLRDAAEAFQLTFGPDPATHSRCTLGGMIGNNSCGVHSIMAGKTDENIEKLRVMTWDGLELEVGATSDAELAAIIAAGGRRAEIYAALAGIRDRYADLIRARFPKIKRNVSGYGLHWLLPENGFHVARSLVGSESTCAITLEATVKLVDSPPVRRTVVIGFDDVFAAADAVPEVMSFGPIGLEGFDDRLVADMAAKNMLPENVALLPPGKGWLLVEFGGWSIDEATEKARKLVEAAKPRLRANARFFEKTAEAAMVWKVRESALGATAVVPGRSHAWEGWEDAAVPPEKLGNYLRDLRGLLDSYGYIGDFYGHFGDGCVHTRNNFDLQSEEGIAAFRRFIFDAADLCISYGGSVSGEHGDGQARGELLPRMFGEELVEAFREFKRAWDPGNRMNPGKLIDPYRIDENLRLGADFHPPEPATHYQWPNDAGSFNHAMGRCVGVGACRKTDSGTMCPSYMVTGVERHSTRGRARLLFEMVKGEGLVDGWNDEGVREALDLCLACKACKTECPVNVDMASYKAEYFSHYYENRKRPRAAWTMGWIHRWGRLAAISPRISNFLASTEPFSGALKRFVRVHPKRELPRFAEQGFRSIWRAHTRVKRMHRGRVMLWVDTFAEQFEPAIAASAAKVLERMGFEVVLSPPGLCCGRPLYDWGYLEMAKKQLHQILDAIGDGDTPIVGLEPSCIAVFRDELQNLFAGDPRAVGLGKRMYTFAEFALAHADDVLTGRSSAGRAVLHGHCHQKSLIGMKSDMALLGRIGWEPMLLDSGCCGMAGAFGFEEDHYGVSVALAERRLLPAIREMQPDDVLISDGFSCREQVRQLAGVRAMHIAELVERETRPRPEAS